MARVARPWFRFYVEAVHDRKLRRLSPGQRWLWVVVLAAARQSPVPGQLLVGEGLPMDVSDLADLAAMPARDVRRTMSAFEEAGMVARPSDLGFWVVCRWAERQYESDDVTVRTRKHRSNHPGRNDDGTFQRRSMERSGNGEGTVLGTMTETDTDTETSSSTRTTHQGNPQAVENRGEEGIIQQALQALAERDLARRASNGQPVRDPNAWLAAATQRHAQRHAQRLTHIPAGIITPTQLANWLEPTNPLEPTVAAQAAHAEHTNRLTQARNTHPCPHCDATGLTPNTTPATICPNCKGTGTTKSPSEAPARPAETSNRGGRYHDTPETAQRRTAP